MTDLDGNASVFWEGGRVRIMRHCEGVFTLEVDGEQEMGPCAFDPICRYVWWEWPPF